MKKTSSGFTIVELLIVIVVIGILAAITVVAYNGVQARTRDSIRMDDVAKIRKALELHKIDNSGKYPTAVASPGIAAWEVSIDNGFMQSLSPYLSVTPVDPKNNSTSHYAYYRSPAGTQGCPASAGAFYVLRVNTLEAKNGTSVSDLGACASSGSLSTSRQPTATQAVFFGFEGN